MKISWINIKSHYGLDSVQIFGSSWFVKWISPHNTNLLIIFYLNNWYCLERSFNLTFYSYLLRLFFVEGFKLSDVLLSLKLFHLSVLFSEFFNITFGLFCWFWWFRSKLDILIDWLFSLPHLFLNLRNHPFIDLFLFKNLFNRRIFLNSKLFFPSDDFKCTFTLFEIFMDIMSNILRLFFFLFLTQQKLVVCGK